MDKAEELKHALGHTQLRTPSQRHLARSLSVALLALLQQLTTEVLKYVN